MPREGAIVFGDLTGKLGSLRVVCSKCERAGSYRVARLIQERGREPRSPIGWPTSPAIVQRSSSKVSATNAAHGAPIWWRFYRSGMRAIPLCTLFLLVATLCSCTESKQEAFGSCRAETPSNRTDAGTQEFMDACMQSKGYGPALNQAPCHTEPVCYKPVTALTWFRSRY